MAGFGGDKTWIAVQQNTFTNWCNSSLKGTGNKIEDLVTDLDDGVKLVVLLEQLSKKKVSSKIHYKPRIPAHRAENLEMAFDFMKNKEKIHMVNIGPRDIQEHNQKIILGLVWHLILKYQILTSQPEPTVDDTKPGKKIKPPSAKKLLINWLRAAMPEDCQVKNVTSSWNDGKNLSALVNTMKPGLCPNYASLSPADALPNTKKAMDQADEEFDIPQIIDPEHLCIDKPDELSCMTYLSYFCSGDDSPGYNSLLEWVRSKIPDYNIENFTDDWRDGRALSALVNAIAEGTVPNHAELDPSKGVDNIRSAMKTANDNLDGIENNITPEEFADKRTDALAMMGYIEWFRKARPKQKESLSAVGPGITGGAPVGIETYFHVKGNVNPKLLHVKLTSPEGDVVPVTPAPSENPTFHKFIYTPTKPGKHTVNIDKDGTPIPGSPFFPVFTAKTDPTRCLPDGPGLTRGKVGTPANFTVDCHRAGPGSLQVTINSPSGADVPATITGDSTYNVQYTPEEAGPHNIVILYADHQVKGSPFTAIVYDPSKVVASGDGLSHGVTGEKAEFTIRTEGAGPGKPVVKVMGPWRSVPCDVEEVDEHLYKCTYTPEEGGAHPINIMFADEGIPGSPFTALVEEAIPVDAHKVKVDGPHCPQMHRGPVSGVCDVSEAGDGQLTATCYSKKYGDVPVEVGPQENGSHNVLFNPPGKDVFHLSVLWSGDHVPGSPFDIDLNPPLANEVRVDGPHPCPDGIGPVHAYIDTSDAGDGVLDVKSSGERLGPVEVKVVEKDACVYDASFEAFQPDIYHMDVKWSGVHVPGSTFRIPVDLGEGLCTQEVLEDVESAYVPASFSDVYDSGESKEYQEPDIPESIPSFHVGEKLSVTVDKEGQGDAGHVTADCRGDTAGPVPVNMMKNSDGTYTATIDPRVPDLYTVNVLMDGEHVPSSPFKVRYLPPQTDATKCRVYNRPPPEKRLVAHDDIMYNVDASKAGAGDLTVQSEGPSGGKTNTNLQVVPKEGSDFKIIYTPTKAGTHKHYIYWSKEAIPDSPVEFEVSPRDIPVYPWSKSIGIDYEFPGLKPKDLSGHVIYQPTGKKLKLGVEKNKVEPEKAHITFKPTDAGIYEIHILHHKNHVRGSPFKVHILKPPNPNKVKVNGLENAKCYVGDSVAFSVDCTEAGTGELLVKADSPSKDDEPSQLDIVDNQNNSYDGTYIPSTVGDHQLHVKWADQPVPGSPFTIKVQSDGTKEEIGTTSDPSKCFILPEDLEVMSTPFEHNQLVNFRVSTLNAGPGTLNVTSRGPSRADVVITDIKDGIYSVKFSPSEPGKYKLDVTWDDVNIKGSPFEVMVNGDKDRWAITGMDLSNIRFALNEKHPFTVLCDDLGDGPFDVQVEPPTDASITIRDLGKQTYHVTLVPKEPGAHKVSVLHGNQHILGSPFSCQFQQFGDASKCRLLEDAEEQQHEVGEEVSFMVTTEGAGPGTLSASVKNVQKKTSRPADVKQLDETTYRVTFDPGQEEEYLLSIKYDNAHIVGSPCSLVLEH